MALDCHAETTAGSRPGWVEGGHKRQKVLREGWDAR